jgi:hypothetical protein
MPHDFILQRIMISISTLSKYVREKKHLKTIKPSFVPGGGAREICTGPMLHLVQMCGICTEYLARYKCEPSFVPDALYRYNTRYK